MNTVNGSQQSDATIPPHVVLNIPQAQLIQYLASCDNRLQEERKKEIHERFRNIQCFQQILGTSKSFKLTYNKPIFSQEEIFIEPQIWGSSPIRVWPNSAPKTMAMSLHNENEPAFVTYVNDSNGVTVFCPEIQEPIGRIVKKGNNEADVFCLATSKTFTIQPIQSENPASIRIADSQGRIVGVAHVSHWKQIKKYTTTTYLKEFALQVENGLSEPTRIMLLVSFANWAITVYKKNRRRNRTRSLIILSFFFLVLLVILFYNLFYYNKN